MSRLPVEVLRGECRVCEVYTCFDYLLGIIGDWLGWAVAARYKRCRCARLMCACSALYELYRAQRSR